jgi:myosin heavy subunit
VAVNPFKSIEGIYSPQQAVAYTSLSDCASQPPHIFATADAAFTSMADSPPGKLANQVCVISGESGAGKTESAKLFIKHIIFLSTRLGVANADNAHEVETAKGLEEKIIQLNPLLEAFGNAQTLMNDNSSRFGKFIELRFSAELYVQGVLMYEYLLEKSRVVQQGPGEQNFHVFYLYFAGLSEELKKTLDITTPERHRFIRDNPEALAKISSKLYVDMWDELVGCMNIVGFSPEEVNDLWALLAGVIHSGDIEFVGED